MYKGKHSGKKRSRWTKSAIMMASLILICTMVLGGTLAYIFTGTRDVENTFTPSKVTTLVEETVENGAKTDVKIKNTGDTDAFIRATVVVTWQNEDHEVYGKAPVLGTDYTISFNTSAQQNPVGKWTKGSDGFYYWSNSVAPNKTTGELISNCTYTANAPDGYSLAVEIIGSGIQSRGLSSDNKAPVVEAWGEDNGGSVTGASDGVLTVATSN